MLARFKNAIRRADERARHRREYGFLLQQDGDQIFKDIGVQRADVARMRRNLPLF